MNEVCVFINVDGLPITVGHPEFSGCRAWDKSPPREFPIDSAMRNGVYVSVEDFEKLLTLSQAGE